MAESKHLLKQNRYRIIEKKESFATFLYEVNSGVNSFQIYRNKLQARDYTYI